MTPTDTTIYLVRHGETAWNAAGTCQGTSDVPMNEAGRAQVDALAERLRAIAFGAAYTSPLIRARETAVTVLRGRGILAMRVPELIELSYGDLQGSAPDTWDAALRRAWENEPWSVTFPNGESLGTVQTRVVPVLEQIVAVHRGETVLISAHGHVNRVLALHALGRPSEDFWSIEQANASALMLRFHESGAIV